MGVDSINFDQTVPEIFYFKRDIKVSNILIFIGNANVNNRSVVSDAIPVLT